tara:strand:+ start:708 stop:2735 length:2028 start_codon:yes stop_codon:yes gene_type:complete
MAYIGRAPTSGFFEKQDITGDGSTTTFTLTHTIGSTSAIIVSVGGVIQEPTVAYVLASGGTQITFTTAPSSTDNVYIQYLGDAVTQNLNDINGTEFILDTDGDTSFTADTDDEVDIKVGGSDISTIKSTGFHNIDSIKYIAGTGDDLEIYHDGTNSFIANKTGALKIATETSGIAVTIGHSTSEVTVADNMTVAGDLTVTGTANFGDTNITNVGSITLDTVIDDGGTITLDSSGDIVLDAAGNDIFFKAGGTTIGEFENESNNLIIKSSVSDADLIIRGNDGGSEISALTFDMSAGGAATFVSTVTAAGFTIGNAVIGEAELEILDGLAATTAELAVIDGDTSATSTTVADADRVVMNDNGTMVQVAVTDLAAYFDDEITAMPNLTSVGTLGALTVDDVAIDGKVITMTGSSSDTAVITAGTNGTLSIVTTDDSAAAANITITADGTFEADGTTITLDSSGDVVLDAGGADVVLKDDGTTFGSLTNSSGELVIKSGSTPTTAMTFSGANVTFAGTVTIGSAGISEAELEILDGATVTTTELNLIDGDTARGTTALADGDGILINDAGTMRMTNVTAVKTYMQSGLSSDELIDADSDTKIQVEESSDEDTIRFDVAGAETATMTAKGFELTAVGGFFINQTTNSQTLTIAAAENAIMGGPVTYSGTITVEGNLSII